MVKSYLISLSDSPNHLLTSSAELTEKKVQPTAASVAQAFAKNDFPVPGGPYRRIPRHGFLSPVNNYGNRTGSTTVSCNAAFACSSPATSLHLTFGLSVIIAPAKDS